MASRTWLAISLACLIWFSYLKWFAPPPPSTTATPTTQASTTTTSAETAAPVAPSGSLGVEALSETIAVSENLVKASNPNFEISFSPMGGKIETVKLNTYRESIKKDAEPVRPVSPELSVLSLGTTFSDPVMESLAQGQYAHESAGNKFVFSRTNSKGVKAVKTYEVAPTGYFVDSTYTFTFPKDVAAKNQVGYLSIPVGAKNLEYHREEPLKSWEVVTYQNEKIHRTAWDSIKEGEALTQGTSNWVSFGNRYFSSAVINQSEINPDILVVKNPQFTGAVLRYPIVLKAGQNEVTFKLKHFIGPKVVSEISSVPGLKQLVDYGMFSVFAYPLLELLRFFYKFVHNYGIAIILLTLVVRGLFYPLSLKSYRSMKEMQKLQPQIAIIKEKYKNDMARLNQEQMALFKAHKVNPMGGCFPMLVQLPVFIALYAVLANSIELFHAPFFGWVLDLSTKDPFYIYPVLMGIAMFLQQKLTPAVGMDPAQQKIMLLMPIIFTFMMISLPAGLTLYIFLSTILGVLQQWAMMRGTNNTSSVVTVPSPSPQK